MKVFVRMEIEKTGKKKKETFLVKSSTHLTYNQKKNTRREVSETLGLKKYSFFGHRRRCSLLIPLQRLSPESMPVPMPLLMFLLLPNNKLRRNKPCILLSLPIHHPSRHPLIPLIQLNIPLPSRIRRVLCR